ncbi:putative ATPase [Streptomyces sp. MP131-18]|nr:putative ATPase [Streptomyces sp. MP131-18]
MTETAVPHPVRTAGGDTPWGRGPGRLGGAPTGTAVWRLRSRGCWDDAAALLDALARSEPPAALLRAELLVERCMFTSEGWGQAEEALRAAESLSLDDEERGAAACERGYLAYAATLLRVRDRADEARAALGRAAALLAPDSPGRPLLDFRRGLMAQHISGNPQAAEAAYRRAHNAALAGGDALLGSYTWRHLAALALDAGEVSEARHGFAESLRMREETGFLIGIAPALVALADAMPEPEAGRLMAEAGRLYRLLGGVPRWLADRLPRTP